MLTSSFLNNTSLLDPLDEARVNIPPIKQVNNAGPVPSGKIIRTVSPE